MNKTASKCPEYLVDMAMNGVGTALGRSLQKLVTLLVLLTKEPLTDFAGVDSGVN